MYTFYDTHCHFDFPPFAGDETASLNNAKQAGIQKIIVPAIAANFFPRVLHLANTYSLLYAALGLHPIVIEQHYDQGLAELEACLQHRPAKLVALGEIGLDLFRDDPQFDKQCYFLDKQLSLAGKYDMPVILHSRRTHDQLAGFLRRHKLPRTGVVHGFTGSLQQARQFIALGYFIGVGGTITYSRANKTRNAIAALPLSALLLETDAPDMPVQGFQGQPNRPERVALIFDALCSLRSESPDVLADALVNNAERLFFCDTPSL